MNVKALRIAFAGAFVLPALWASAQGDDCANAVSVVPGTHSADGPATGAGFDGTCFGIGTATNADWYVYTPAANGTITVQACGYGADTRVSVFGGSCAALTCLGFGDDECEMCPGCSFFASQVAGVPVTAGQNYYIQWDDRWTTQAFDWDLLFFCQGAPQATQSVIPDCANGTFTISINITSLGSGTAVDITNNGGAPTLSNVGLGTHVIGPFPLGTNVQYVLTNNVQAGCDYFSPNITNFPCPLVTCGPDTFSYCYTNGEDTYFVYQSATTFPVAILFNDGTFYQFDGDQITIYDGLDAFAPILYQGDNNGLTFAGMFFASNNAFNALTLRITSDAFTSCQDFGLIPLNYTVGCLDCIQPQATFDVVLDCTNNQFFVEVDVTSIGTDPVVDVTNTAGAPPLSITSPGVYQVGPFPDGTNVTVTLENDVNPLCNVGSGVLTNFPCPIVSCGPDNYTHCYGNNEDTYLVYQSASTDPLALIFNAGEMYQFDADELIVHDGLNGLAPVIFQGNNNGLSFAGMLFTSNNPDNALTLHISSDAFTSCQDFGLVPFDYTVACLDCTNPQATFTVVPDCFHQAFSIQVNVTSTGTANTVDITNSQNSTIEAGLGVGMHTIGPFPINSSVTLTVLNGDNPLCRVNSQPLTWTTNDCIIVSCGIDSYSYCYENGDDGWYFYQSANSTPLYITFNAGEMLAGDKVVIHNGLDQFAAVIFNGNQNGNLAGVAANSNNTLNQLGLRILANASGSCGDGGVGVPLQWKVGCGTVDVDELAAGSFRMYPNPTDGLLYIEVMEEWSGTAHLRVADVTGRVVLEEPVAVQNGQIRAVDLGALQNGNYIVQLITDRWLKARQVQVLR